MKVASPSAVEATALPQRFGQNRPPISKCCTSFTYPQAPPQIFSITTSTVDKRMPANLGLVKNYTAADAHLVSRFARTVKYEGFFSVAFAMRLMRKWFAASSGPMMLKKIPDATTEILQASTP